MDYVAHILIVIAIYAILGISLNLLAGYTGMVSISQAAFFGIGAYASALLTVKLGVPTWISLGMGVCACGVCGAVIALASLRLRDDYFVAATFSFQVIVFGILNNWVSLTGGPLGVPGVPPLDAWGWKIASPLSFLVLVAMFLAVTLWVSHRIVASPFGRVLRAIREDEVLTEAVGKSVATFKILVSTVSSCAAGLAGGLYVYYISFIDPTSFTVMESIFIISIVIIGGAGDLCGSVLGALVMIVLAEALRFVGLPTSVAANVRQMAYGGLLVAFMIFRPHGLIGEYAFQKSSEAP